VVVGKSRRGAGPRSLPDPKESRKKFENDPRPKDWADAVKNEKHVKRGEVCSQCRHWVDKKKGHEELQRDQFWERAFLYHGDGTDLGPRHLGDPREYSVCNKRGVAVHELAPWCEDGGK
jgi:hypothetical protein